METQKKVFEILEAEFKSLNPRKIADSVLRLSDFYIQFPESPTPWHENWCQEASFAYYLPLNLTRAQRVIQHGRKAGFFNGLAQLIDFGSGLGPASLQLQEIPEHYYIERSTHAQKLHQKLGATGHWITKPESETNLQKKTLAIFSYSLTEIVELPPWAYQCEALMIIEPATQQDGRQLLQLREQLIEKGFHAWAPCTHQGPCPLLHESKNDWCHDRVVFEQPAWFSEVEKHLPIKNRTIAMSYLLMRKTVPAVAKNQARLVGDQLFEKGKSRILVCRSSKREYLTWMQRHWPEPPPVKRGDLIDWPEQTEEKANEIRVKFFDNK